MPAKFVALAKGARAVGKALANRRGQDAVAGSAGAVGLGAKAKGSQSEKYPDPVASRARTTKQRDR